MRYPRAVTAVAVLALCALAIRYAVHVPAVLPASALPTEFSAERAMVHVRTIAAMPHRAGSARNAVVRDYIIAELRKLGLSPEIQDATGVGTRYPQAGHVQNVVVRVPGAKPGGQAALLMAHYDGVPAAPAAADDASGSSVLLETVRALRSGSPLQNDVIALFTDAEEAGLLGAAAFAREHPWAKDAAVVLNFEARGTFGPSLMFETGAGNRDVVTVLSRLPGVRATSLSTAVYRQLPNDTDLSEMMVLGQPALNFAFIGGENRYHTSHDDVAHLSVASVQHHGNQALALARAFGDGPLPRPTTGDAVFFDFPGIGLIVYPEDGSLLFALIAAGLVIFARRRLGPHSGRDIALGVAGILGSVIVAALAGIGGAVAVGRLHEALASGAPEWSGVYAAAIAFLGVAISATFFTLTRRRAHVAALHVGALTVWAVIALLLALFAKGVTFIVTWPLIAIAAGVAAAPSLRGRGAMAMWWVCVAVAVFIVVPIIYLMVCMGLGLQGIGGAILGTFTALGVWLLAPVLADVAGARPWRAVAWSGAMAILLFVIGAATNRTNAERPAGASFHYLVDADSSRAWLTGFARTGGGRQWLRASLRTMAPNGSKEALPFWIRARFDATNVVAVAFAPARPPDVRVIYDSTKETTRRVSLRIVPPPLVRGAGTLSIGLAADSGVVLGAVVEGRAVDGQRYRVRSRRWRLDYVAPPDSGFSIVLTMPATAKPVLDLLARAEGIPVRVPSRPPGIIPSQAGDYTTVYRRLRL